ERERGERERRTVEAVDHEGPSELPVVRSIDDERRDPAEDEGRDLLEQVAVRVARRLAGRDGRCAVDHHAAEERQRHEGGEEDLVRGALLSHLSPRTVARPRRLAPEPRSDRRVPRSSCTGRTTRTPARGARYRRAAPARRPALPPRPWCRSARSAPRR